MTSHVASHLAAVRTRIAQATQKAGRPVDDVQLVAVSKRFDADHIRAAYAAGQRVFGENYVQELVEKIEALKDLVDIRFRFIGGLQRNKVKYLAPHGVAIDTVDSLRLAETIATRYTAEGTVCDALIQVNIGREPQKSGCLPEALPELVEAVRRLDGIRLRGLMTIPPDEAPEQTRRHFHALARMAEDCGLPELSMGMSADLEQAILEGATMVRIGTAIFGERPPR